MLWCGKAQAGATRHGVVGKGIARPSEPWRGRKRPFTSSSGRGRWAGGPPGRFGSHSALAANITRRPKPLTCHSHCHTRRGALSETHARNRHVGHRREPAAPSPHHLVGTRLPSTHGTRAPSPLPVNWFHTCPYTTPDALHQEELRVFYRMRLALQSPTPQQSAEKEGFSLAHPAWPCPRGRMGARLRAPGRCPSAKIARGTCAAL